MNEPVTFTMHVWAEGVVTSTNGEPTPDNESENQE